MLRRIVTTCAVVATAAAAFGFSSQAAWATVSATPATWTPQVTSTNATVREIVQCGSTMYAVGSFSTVKQGSTTYTRANAFSFSATTGVLTAWNPRPNGQVNTVALNGSCTMAYLGGTFSTVAAASAKNIAAVNTTSGTLVSSFAHSASGAVNNIQVVNASKEVMVGGNYTSINGSARGYFASLNPTTGAVDSYMTLAVAGTYGGNSGPTKIYNQQLSSRGDRLLVEGTFTTIGGVAHRQVAELDLSSTKATLDAWSNATINSTSCAAGEEFYARAAAFSPDESTIYVAATGYVGSSPYCDAVAAFANTAAAPVKWINYTGGDSLYAVASGPSDVYIGGHERWANNPQGRDSCGPGCLSRPGIADISAGSGLATSWNPTRDRGHGADDMLVTSAGLWVASDTFYNSVKCANLYHPGICFFPGTA